MSLNKIRIKKNHSPARMISFEEPLVQNLSISLSKLKSRRTNLSILSPKKSQTPSEQLTKISFSVKHPNEIYFFHPPPLKLELINKSNLKYLKKNSESIEKINPNLNPLRDLKQILVDRKVKLEQISKSAKSTEKFYFKMIKENNDKDLAVLLIKYPGLVNYHDFLGMTGLHWAAKRNFVEIGKMLLSCNADVFRVDVLGRTCRDIAKKSKNKAFLKMISEFLYNKQYAS